MARTPKYLMENGKPYRWVGEKTLTPVDQDGNPHEIMTEQETLETIRGSRDLLIHFVRAGVIQTVAPTSGIHTRLYSANDVRRIAATLFPQTAGR